MSKLIIAISGASGSIYAKSLLQSLFFIKKSSDITDVALVVSSNGKEVYSLECKTDLLSDLESLNREGKWITLYDNNNFFSPIASGSTGYESMVVIPCSMGIIGRIASGVSNDLITRSADVILKERRKLILVPRESPYNSIHLENMLKLSNLGTIIAPASPSFYFIPSSIEDLSLTFASRIISLLGYTIEKKEWMID